MEIEYPKYQAKFGQFTSLFRLSLLIRRVERNGKEMKMEFSL